MTASTAVIPQGGRKGQTTKKKKTSIHNMPQTITMPTPVQKSSLGFCGGRMGGFVNSLLLTKSNHLAFPQAGMKINSDFLRRLHLDPTHYLLTARQLQVVKLFYDTLDIRGDGGMLSGGCLCQWHE